MNQAPNNRLIHETSPYLLQHAHNPVDWYPWGEEALTRAREWDRPILLSVGYSSCHWCHVMERESFENPEIAALMNELFINIKVDREERPDVDSIYMSYVQMTTGQGGWPLTVFLTPELTPFFGGTYFPPEDAYGRPGFKTLLKSVSGFFKTRRAEIEERRDEIRTGLSQASRMEFGESEIHGGLLDRAAASLLSDFDARFGGFGRAPKFPQSMVLNFLLRWGLRNGNEKALEAVRFSLLQMGRGGIYDQLGGGFHRYSVDDRWFAPHFEKMLYDNALLARTYTEAFQATGEAFFRDIALETLEYLRRDLRHPAGGFFSAEDADSSGVEGKFYAWSWEEIEAVLGPDQTAVFAEQFGVTREGNWEGTNILHLPGRLEPGSRGAGNASCDARDSLEEARRRLFERREERERPGLDDKILASWNGMALTAFALAGFVFDDRTLLETAIRNAEFLAGEMIHDGILFRSWKEGEVKFRGYLEDYAHVVEGMLRLFQVTGQERWLRIADELTQRQLEEFLDDESGDFFFTSADHDELLVRPKEYFDNATPSGNSTSAANLLVLAELTGRSAYRERAERLLEKIAPAVERMPSGLANWLCALDFSLGPVTEIVLVAPPERWAEFLAPLRPEFLPALILLPVGGEVGEPLSASPLLEGRPLDSSEAVVYLCEDRVCREPVTEPEKFAELLRAGIEGRPSS